MLEANQMVKSISEQVGGGVAGEAAILGLCHRRSPASSSQLHCPRQGCCQSLASWSSGTVNHTALFCYLVGSDLDAGRICGYGTARCRRNCKKQEFKVGKCPNTYPCCLKKWNGNSLNPSKDRKPKGAWLLEMAASQTSEPPFSRPSRRAVPSGSSLVD